MSLRNRRMFERVKTANRKLRKTNRAQMDLLDAAVSKIAKIRSVLDDTRFSWHDRIEWAGEVLDE